MKLHIQFLFALTFSLAAVKTYAASDSLSIKKAACFQSARVGIEEMLEGRKPLSYERAVFLMENAYWQNRLSYDQFQAAIDLHLRNILQFAERNQNKLVVNYNPATIYEMAQQSPEEYREAMKNVFLNWAIFSYMLGQDKATGDGKPEPRFAYSHKDPFGNDGLVKYASDAFAEFAPGKLLCLSAVS